MKKILKSTSTAALMCLLLSSCGGEDPVQKAINEVEEQTTQYFKMQETWSSTCLNSTLLETSIRKSYQFNGESFKENHTIFNDANCSEKIGEASFSGDFEVEKREDRMMDLNLHYKNLNLTADTSTAVNIFNAVNLCGISDWSEGVERKVSGENIENCFISSLPVSNFGKVQIDDSEDKLYLSDEFSETADNRPSTVDIENPYTEKSVQ